MKWLSLILLVIQNTTQSILIHYSKVRPKAVNYLQTSVVFWSEIVKLVISICAFSCEENQGPTVATKIIYNALSNTLDTVKVGGLSLLYTVQNNLVFYAAAHLEPSLFQVLLQAKLLFTAIFSVCILKRSLSRLQWVALLLLTTGMALAQINQHRSVHITQSTKLDHSIQEMWLGTASVLGATALSGFSGVYLEKILKHTKPSLWLRNVQLAISAVPISAILLIMEQSTPPRRRLFHDYDWLVVLLILWFASGGIIVALAIKHADNILKGFANALAIVVTSLCTIYLFNFRPSREFCFGVVLVILSIGLYVGNWSAQTTTPSYQKIDTNLDNQLSDVVCLKTTNGDGDESITHKSVHNSRKRSTTFINIVVSTSDLKRRLNQIPNHAVFVHQYQLHNLMTKYKFISCVHVRQFHRAKTAQSVQVVRQSHEFGDPLLL
ncbi:UDP-galactose/UDP-N-acetylglucosamine transporter srf-3, partial [Trichinella nelsoni]